MATPTPDDAGAIAKIFAGLGTAAAIVGGWWLKFTHDQIGNKVDKDTYAERGRVNDEKHAAITAEMNMQRGNIKAIFEDIADFKQHTNHQFNCLTKQIDEKHISLLKAIHEIGKK